MKIKEKKIVFLLIISLIAIDQLLKIALISTKLNIGNPDGFFIGIIENTKSENNIQYILVSIIIVTALCRYIIRNNTFIKMNSRILISFAIAGAISNCIDRIWNKNIINYINIPHFISINLGYIYIAITWVGMAIILTKYTSDRLKEKELKK